MLFPFPLIEKVSSVLYIKACIMVLYILMITIFGEVIEKCRIVQSQLIQGEMPTEMKHR